MPYLYMEQGTFHGFMSEILIFPHFWDIDKTPRGKELQCTLQSPGFAQISIRKRPLFRTKSQPKAMRKRVLIGKLRLKMGKNCIGGTLSEGSLWNENYKKWHLGRKTQIR